ncbi:MAG: nitrogen fixation protein NifH [Anaerolineae bacterium]
MSNSMDWLLAPDLENPGVRWFTLTSLLGHPGDDPVAIEARQQVMAHGPVPAILNAQQTGGYWEKPGHGYSPKYRGTVWSLIYLAQLGADPADARVRAAGDYVLEHARAKTGVFTATGTPSGHIACLAGNLSAALLDLGFDRDTRLQEAIEWMARYTTGEGIAADGEPDAVPRYYRSGTCGPGFQCAANNRLPCAWGAVKVLRGLARVPSKDRTPSMEAALQAAVEFLFSADPATADYPAGYNDKPSRSWFRFGFPVFYVTDVLQLAEALTEAGYGRDPRLEATYDLILSKRDAAGRWHMTYSYQGKTWADAEQRHKPSKWVTLRALRVLKGGGIHV